MNIITDNLHVKNLSLIDIASLHSICKNNRYINQSTISEINKQLPMHLHIPFREDL